MAIVEGSKDFDQIKQVTSLEDIQRSYSHLTNCDPFQDMLFAEADGEPIAYCRVFWKQLLEGDRIYWHLGTLLPEWRRKGIGRTMLRWCERRLLQIASGHANDGERFFQTSGADTQVGKEALVLSEGYEPVRHEVEMARALDGKLPDLPIPPGLEVRPAKEEHIRPIWEASVEAFRDHWGYAPPTEETFPEWLEEPTFNPELWKVAWDGDRVAGMVLNFIDERENEEYNRKRGYTEGISVRRPWRRRGLARALIAQSFHMLRDLGMEEAALSVDTQNLSGAFRLYKGMGFERVKRWTDYRKPLEE
ncbi:MAG: GNAT family N-acetyltransferase [Anaerolineae bacterium]|nr:MAG: GNAT family N-acetyltransferase [Anaerolineae bacterium]